MKKPSQLQRQELGAFLVAEGDVCSEAKRGFPIGQRRTPGLRREEVASLAGVSVRWYTWLGQGRDIAVSTEALERLSDALRLDRAGSSHLFARSSRQSPAFKTSGRPSDGLIHLLQAIEPVPAYIRNDRLDILAWNPAVADLSMDYGKLEPHERNTLWLMFLYPPYRTIMRTGSRISRGRL